jgi:hypothetical protein
MNDEYGQRKVGISDLIYENVTATADESGNTFNI